MRGGDEGWSGVEWGGGGEGGRTPEPPGDGKVNESSRSALIASESCFNRQANEIRTEMRENIKWRDGCRSKRLASRRIIPVQRAS